jgi:rhodanese-related sulfurtransferase
MTKLLWRALLLVIVGMALGLAGNQVSPKGIPIITPPKRTPRSEEFLSLDQAKQFWSNGSALFLDAREEADFAAGHIANAFNLPALSVERHFPEVAPLLTTESLVVVYCDGTECELSHRLAEHLRQQGFTNVHMLFNGWTTWRQAGLPTEGEGQK